jgi:hypothetical protein
MYRIRYEVHYDIQGAGRSKKPFGPDKGRAVTWAREQPARSNPEVVAITTETIWRPQSDN